MKKKKLADFKVIEKISASQALQLKGGNESGGGGVVHVITVWPA